MIGTRHLTCAVAAVALALGFVAAAAAQSELTPEAAAQKLAERYGVEVLDVAEAEEDGRPVYVVTVMNPGGNYNAAFRVTRLMIDRTTGELVSQFDPGAGDALSGGIVTDGANGRAIRRQSLPQSAGQDGG